MRPLNLKMSAFASYAGEVEIPFQKFGEKALFLVSGDTGAGKTTIFDAISFALFGNASGENRTPDSLRSDYARPEQRTYVELEFLHAGKRYKIERNPAYTRPMLKKEGTTTQTANATMNLPNGEVIVGYQTVSQKVTELLGIDWKQFKQIVMIAQGEFLKLLTADSTERGIIFRKVFSTEIYEQIQKNLKGKANSLKYECEDIDKSILQYLTDSICEKEHSSYEKVESLKKAQDIYQAEEWLQIVKQIFEEDSVTYKTYKRELEDTAAELKIAAEEIAHVNKIKEDEKLFSKKSALSMEELEKIKAVEKKTQIELAKLSERNEHIQEQQKMVLKEEQELKMYPLLVEREKQYDAYKQEIERMWKKSQEALTQQTAWTEEKEAGQERISVLCNVEIEALEKKQREESLQKLKKEMGTLLEVLKKIRLKDDTRGEIQKLFRKSEEEYQKIAACYLEEESKYLRNMAGILAKQLETGVPCPVCGSLEHPNPKKLEAEILDEQELKRRKEEKEKFSKELHELTNKIVQISSEIDTLYENLKSNMQSLEGQNKMKAIGDQYERKNIEQLIPYIENEMLLAEEELEKLCEQRKEIYLKIEEKEKIKKRAEQIEVLIKEAEISLEKVKIEESEKLLKMTELSGIISNMKQQMTFDSEEKARESYEYKKSECENHTKMMDALKEENQKNREKESRINGAITENQQQIAYLRKKYAKELQQDMALLETKYKLKNESYSSRTKEKEELYSRLSRNEKILEQVEKRLNEQKVKRDSFLRYRDLADTACGELKGKPKIAFEQYVQAFYFEKVLEEANKRLYKMSSSQYMLLRKKEATNIRNAAGLELEVMDYYTGKARSVKSLSGGEAFQASLSLALGLSDVIQCHAGGIEVDAMFIDEGFGSLDSNALEKAIDTLNMLTKGNRIVGIISHVNELKERIDKKINVEKTIEGGRITMAC